MAYGATGAYGASPYSFGVSNPFNNTISTPQNGTIQLSAVTPYVENDKSSRVSAIFEGISGTINSLGQAYQRIKFNPQPIGAFSSTAPPFYGAFPTQLDAQGLPVTFAPPVNKTLLVIGAILLVVFFLMMKKR